MHQQSKPQFRVLVCPFPPPLLAAALQVIIIPPQMLLSFLARKGFSLVSSGGEVTFGVVAAGAVTSGLGVVLCCWDGPLCGELNILEI